MQASGKTRFLLTLLAVSAFGLLACAAAGDAAAGFPNKTVEIIVPAGAGGDTDFNARLLAQYLSKSLNGNFIISNVTGAGGATGTRKVKDSKNDGYTVLFYHSAFVVNQLSGAANFGFEAFDFACIAAMSPGNCITVQGDKGFKTLKDLIDYSKKHPNSLTIAAQTGATTHASALLLQKAGADLTIVDSGGASERLAALLGGHVDVILSAYGNIKDYVSEGTLTPIALDGLKDLDLGSKKITSVETQGYHIGFPFYYFFAFPKGTDPAVVNKFCAAVEDIIKNNKEYAEKIGSTYYQVPTYYGPKEGRERFVEVEKLLGSVSFKK